MGSLERKRNKTIVVAVAIGFAIVAVLGWLGWKFGYESGLLAYPIHLLKPVFEWFERFTLEHALAWLRDLLKALIGLAVFQLLFAGYFRRPYLLIRKSAFPNDHLPAIVRSTDEWVKPWKWPQLLLKVLLRTAQAILFLSGLFSRPSIRRLLYVAFNPFLRRKREEYFEGRWSFLRVLEFLDVFVPRRVYARAQIYLETDLLTHKRPTEDEEQHSERVCGEYTESVREWKRSRVPKRILCDSCFDIFAGQNQDKIEAYFQTQQELRGQSRFLSPIKFKSGFLAPTYLVSGPLAEFDEDWTKIVDSYDDKLKGLRPEGDDPLKSLPELRKLQSFIWDCWVQWGPSVPISRSVAWTAQMGAPQKEVALQFGYGDENNSLPICLKHSRTAEPASDTEVSRWWGHTFDEWKAELPRIRSEAPQATGVACPVRVEGHLNWLVPKDRSHRFCQAQHDTKRRDDQPDDNEEKDGWLVFEADSIHGDPTGPLSYSAYIWVLIAICEGAGDNPVSEGRAKSNYRLVHSGGQDLWRGLIPFFQHGNIAEECVYNDIKAELAGKVVDTLIRELKAPHSESLHFAFVAAFDDNGDMGKSQPVMSFPGESIHQMMQDVLKNRFAKDLSLTEITQRIHLDADAVSDITACHLPTIVQGYLDHIDRISREVQARSVANPPTPSIAPPTTTAIPSITEAAPTPSPS